MGELKGKYYDFLARLQQFLDYKKYKLYNKQEKSLEQIVSDQENAIISANEKISIANDTMIYAKKFYRGDSILFSKKVISEAEFDKTKISYSSTKDSYQNAINSLSNTTQ